MVDLNELCNFFLQLFHTSWFSAIKIDSKFQWKFSLRATSKISSLHLFPPGYFPLLCPHTFSSSLTLSLLSLSFSSSLGAPVARAALRARPLLLGDGDGGGADPDDGVDEWATTTMTRVVPAADGDLGQERRWRRRAADPAAPPSGGPEPPP